MNKILKMLTAAILVVTWTSIVASSVALAQQDYKTPQDAVDALVATARSGDQKAALVVLGRGGEDIISSGDKVSDDAIRERFVTSYDAKHQIAMDGDRKSSLGASATTNSMLFRLALPMWTRRMIMLRKIAATAKASMPDASSANLARRTACTGPPRRVRKKARSANCSPKHRARVTVPAKAARLITATITRS